jgi:imidazolonepropionase-like amidohydrolase
MISDRSRFHLRVVTGSWILILMCTGAFGASDGVALLGVNLVNLDDGSISYDRVVILRDGLIEGIFPSDIGAVPPKYEVAAVQGLYLLPAYVDVSPQLDLMLSDEEHSDGSHQRTRVAGELYRSGVLTTLVPGAPMDSAAALSDSLIRIPTGPILEAPSGLPSRWPSPEHVVLLNEQVPMPAQIRYAIPPEANVAVLGIHIPYPLCRRIVHSARRQGLATLAPAATLHCGARDALRSGVDVVEGIGLLALGRAYSGGLSRIADEDGRKEMAWSLWEAPTASQMLSRVLDHLSFEELDSLAVWIAGAEDLVMGSDSLPALCPEFTFLEGSLRERGYQGALVDSLLVLMNKLHRGGMAVVAGSGGLGGEAFLREIDFLQRAGIPPLEIARAACVRGAVLVNRPDPSRLQTGIPADLVLVEGNPLEYPLALKQVRYVIRAGYVLSVSNRGG